METRQFKQHINASRKKVWDTMLEHETYEEWVGVSWPNSSYEGKWKLGSDIKFIGPDGSGTMANIKELDPYTSMVAEHIAILLPQGLEDRASDDAKKWIGTSEGYRFDEKEGTTWLTVTIKARPECIAMFNDGWPMALEKLKELSEA